MVKIVIAIILSQIEMIIQQGCSLTFVYFSKQIKISNFLNKEDEQSNNVLC